MSCQGREDGCSSPLLCVEHRNAWKGQLGKGRQPFPEERDLLRRDAAAAQAALSARGGQSHLEVERLPNGELFKPLTIAYFLLFSPLPCQTLPSGALWGETHFLSALFLYREERQGSIISCFSSTALLEEGLFWWHDIKGGSRAQPPPAPRQVLTPSKPASKHLLVHGNTPLPPQPQLGVRGGRDRIDAERQESPGCSLPLSF